MGYWGASEASGLTVDQGIEDELAVLLHQVVDVSENATVKHQQRLANCVSHQLASSFAALPPPAKSSPQQPIWLLVPQEVVGGRTAGNATAGR